MTDYISREAALNAFTDILKPVKKIEGGFVIKSWRTADIHEIKRILNRVPAADVVEVVRCKDCRYLDDGGDIGRWCDYHGDWITLSDYCYAAERRET